MKDLLGSHGSIERIGSRVYLIIIIKTTQKSADQSTEKSESDQQKRQSDLQTEEANAADPAKSTLSSGEAQADAHSYSGEDEEEGGWIEDVTEDGQNDRR